MARTKREKASRKKREKIINTTMQLLLKKGSSIATSTTDICVAARLNRPTLYHYFGSKRNLLLSVHKAAIERNLIPYLEQAGSMDDPAERLVFMVRSFIRLVCLHPEVRVLIHDELAMRDKHFKEIRDLWKKHYTLLRDTITGLRSQGKLDSAVKSSWAALFVLGMLTWVTYWFDFRRKDNVDELADSALSTVLHGLGFKDTRPG
jgi:AcrR family transcriptional regulator